MVKVKPALKAGVLYIRRTCVCQHSRIEEGLNCGLYLVSKPTLRYKGIDAVKIVFRQEL